MREAAERNLSRAKAIEALYRPLQEAAQRELQKTESGRKVLAEAHVLGKEIGELSKGISSGKTTREQAAQRARERLEIFRQRYGDQFLAARAQQAYLQPSVEAVAQILCPEIAERTTWVSETSFLGAMLLQPKKAPQDVGTVSQGLGGDPPPNVQTCVVPPYERDEEYLLAAAFSEGYFPTLAISQPDQGTVWAAAEVDVLPFLSVPSSLASAFVGHDFAVPPGPTSYKATISYDVRCRGSGWAAFGVAIANVDLAIVIDKRDGTREIIPREISLLVVPVIGGDSFIHDAQDVSVTIPFTRDGSNGTVRIMVGADGQATVVSSIGLGGATFSLQATVHQICLTSVG